MHPEVPPPVWGDEDEPRRVLDTSHCPRCGYRTEKLETCPECGLCELSLERPDWARRRAGMWLRVSMAALLIPPPMLLVWAVPMAIEAGAVGLLLTWAAPAACMLVYVIAGRRLLLREPLVVLRWIAVVSCLMGVVIPGAFVAAGLL
jgi:hypothetical protein